MTSQLKNKTDRMWTVLSCQCDFLEEELCSWLFFQYGTLGIENKILDNEKLLLIASFAQDIDLKRLRLHFEESGLAECAKTLAMEPLADQDWLSNWKIHFEPFKIGNSFFICPPWSTKKLEDENTNGLKKIIIDPGMAFGTGLHATTSFCLQAIAKYLHGIRILDVGTGSGILSIASALSAPKANITAIDMDKNAIDNAKHNIELNAVGNQIKLSQITLENFDQTTNKQFDTIFSNLTAEAIIDYLPTLNKLLASGGNLILAGIIEERLNLLENSISKYPLKLSYKNIDSSWVGMVFSKE